MKTFTVAVVSSHNRFCDIDGNLKHFAELVGKAAARGARLVCFPELALTGYSLDRRIFEIAAPVPGPMTDALAKIASKNKVYLSVGMPEKAGAKRHITQAVIGPDGYMGKYRKHHPTVQEKAHGFSPGREFTTFLIDGVKLGINICADGRQQDTIDPMQKKRVDIVHHPHGNGLGLGKDAEEWTRGKMVYVVSRAIHARAYILVNNSAGDTKCPGGTIQFGSGALVLDPLGQVVKRTAQHTRSEKMIVAALPMPPSSLIPQLVL